MSSAHGVADVCPGGALHPRQLAVSDLDVAAQCANRRFSRQNRAVLIHIALQSVSVHRPSRPPCLASSIESAGAGPWRFRLALAWPASGRGPYPLLGFCDIWRDGDEVFLAHGSLERNDAAERENNRRPSRREAKWRPAARTVSSLCHQASPVRCAVRPLTPYQRPLKRCSYRQLERVGPGAVQTAHRSTRSTSSFRARGPITTRRQIHARRRGLAPCRQSQATKPRTCRLPTAGVRRREQRRLHHLRRRAAAQERQSRLSGTSTGQGRR